MKTSFDSDRSRLRLVFETADEVERFAEGLEREAGFVAQLDRGLKLHQEVLLELVLDAGSAETKARVAQVFDKGFGRYGTALLVDDARAPRDLLAGGESAVEVPATTPSEPPLDDSGEEEPAAPEPAPSATSGEMQGTSPIHRIQQMNPRQRAILAIKAGRTERQILLRDNSPQVLQNLLNNPRIDSEEVLQLARSSHVVAPLLQRIAGDARWSSNQEIIAVIARHPKTPSIFAQRLLPSLRTSDLRIMAKMSSGLKEMVRKAALREYMRRTGQRV